MPLNKWVLFGVLLVFALCLLLPGGIIKVNPQRIARNCSPVPSQFEDKALFLSPIKQVQADPSHAIITGITVPHHLLARDLIAKAFNFASRGKYSKILVICPDHFNLGDSNFSTTERDFSTVFGKLKTDVDAVQKLENLPFVHNQDFFYREHGIGAELPFIKYYFPQARVIALAIKGNASKEQLDQIVDKLKQILTPDSLIVQSTDFSHYLTPSQAESCDKQTLEILKSGGPERLFTLNQPANLDSIAAQYIQMRLQKEFFGSIFHLSDHKNSQDYTKEKVYSSTSYIVQTYFKDDNALVYDGSIIFVGDIMLSRTIGKIMEKHNDYNFPFLRTSDFLNSADIRFGNLECPISDREGPSDNKYLFCASPKVVDGLKKVGFDVLSVANNHMWDYGKDAFVDTLNYMKKAGIASVGGGMNFKEAHKGVQKDINGTKIIFLGYTDLLLKNTSAAKNSAGVSYLNIDQMIKDIKDAKNMADMVVVSLHWGREYQPQHNDKQEQIAKAAIDAGASLIVGHHPHVVQEVEKYKDGYIAYSLGNFVFDQNFSKETQTGLVLKVIIKNRRIFRLEQYQIGFTNRYQPYILHVTEK